MRIRKRFLSLLAATAAPLSSIAHVDVEVQPLVMVQHPQVHPNSSDHTTEIGPQPVSSGAEKTKEMKSLKIKEAIETDDSGRKESIVCVEAKSNDLVSKGWFEGDKLVPIKKRRGSLGNHDHQEDNEETSMEPTKKKIKKNEKRGDVIMEGSRCSRINGRGWRCGQQTLVGYSLCEHHLGNARLRSMSSVRGRAQKVALKEQETKERQNEDIETKSTNHHANLESNDRKVDEQMSSMEDGKKFSKEKKVGVVKERSLSSLLSQLGN